jgi:hypothetical protein
MDETNDEVKKKEPNVRLDLYEDEDEGKFALSVIDTINDDLNNREQSSIVFNGIPYSQAYEYNMRKAINYSPPKDPKDDREVSLGLVHEKIISLASIYLRYVFKRRIKCYDDEGNLVERMGDIYDLAIEFSYRMESFKKKISSIYWELFSQGNAFVLEDWEVKTITSRIAMKKNDAGEMVELNPEDMDYTYEFLDTLEYKDGKQVQTRRAVSKVLDGRMVIFANNEIEELQEQSHITLEESMTIEVAEQIFGTLKMWDRVPKSREQLTAMYSDKVTLFNMERLTDPDKNMIVHRWMDKDNNRFNFFCNGVKMLPKNTPLDIFYPRMNYPITNVPAEKLRGSIYARSVPAKTKFNADFLDWAFKNLALKFEQGVVPAILAKGRYTLTRDIFRAGQVTHGVKKDDYEKADPDNKGVTQSEFSFVELLKQILESQTTNPTTSGEISQNATATEISITENNQATKLGYMLDGIMYGFMDMALRRAETIESKYTIKQKETIVDGKTIPVYQNFSINMAGVEHTVSFDESVGSESYDVVGKRAELHQKAFQDRKNGKATEYYLANPKWLRERRYNLDIEIFPEKIKDTQLHLMQMWDDFAKRKAMFPNDVNMDAMKKEYIEVGQKSSDTFISADVARLQQLDSAGQGQPASPYDTGSFGKPKVADASKEAMMGYGK